MARSKSVGNWEQYSIKQLAALADIDLAAQAEAMGFSTDAAGRVPVHFLSRDYLIGPDGVSATDGDPVDFRHAAVMACYLMSHSQAPLSGEYLPIGRLTGIAVTGSGPSDNLITPLVETFGSDYHAFADAAGHIGGTHEGRSPSGGELWIFRLFPRLILQVVFFEEDDEFPAEIKVLFDSSARETVPYECLELIEMVLVAECLKARNSRIE